MNLVSVVGRLYSLGLCVFPIRLIIGVVSSLTAFTRAVEDEDTIGVLLNGAGFPEVRQAGIAAFALAVAVELAEDDNGEVDRLVIVVVVVW